MIWAPIVAFLGFAAVLGLVLASWDLGADRPVTVAEAVALGRAPHRGWLLPFNSADHEAVRHAMQRAGLADLSERLVTELSAGEMQRVVLARALAQQPAVLLVDEPWAGLNGGETNELAAMLRTMREGGLTLLIVDHKIDFIDSLCDEVVVLQLGRVVAAGPPATVWQDPLVIEAYLGAT